MDRLYVEQVSKLWVSGRPMKVLVELKSGEQGMIVGYGPGKKGQPLAIIVIDDGKLRAVKLRQLRAVGYAKIHQILEEPRKEDDLHTWTPSPEARPS